MTLDELLTEWALDQVCPNSREPSNCYEHNMYRHFICIGNDLIRRLRLEEQKKREKLNPSEGEKK